MDDSKFNLWRATFSFCFVDGFLSPEESTYIEEKLKTLPFSPKEKEILMSDLKSPPEVEKLLPLITRPADRGFLINNVRLLSKVDGLTDFEKEKIQILQERVISKLNFDAVDVVTGEGEISSSQDDFKTHSYSKNLYSDQLIETLSKLSNN